MKKTIDSNELFLYGRTHPIVASHKVDCTELKLNQNSIHYFNINFLSFPQSTIIHDKVTPNYSIHHSKFKIQQKLKQKASTHMGFDRMLNESIIN